MKIRKRKCERILKERKKEEELESKKELKNPISSSISKIREDNEKLVAEITREEVKNALFQMHSDKAPGPDGFNPTFYQRFWNISDNDIFEPVKE
ncbi:CNGC5-like protein [Trifolium medium]|uniref:CNGC5-like protein n=1 Tax=Trifolium medium TaxID=97028 RepID=A0A392M2H3_9FABA|nr:CNGC5-like protein [Trifolium medium]